MKKGFSLIELVLSIVIVGITVVAIPTVLSQTLNNNAQGLIQQSVMDAKTRMALILKSPYSCVGDFSLKDPTPIFGENVGSLSRNFYTRNGITEYGTRRNFGLKKVGGTYLEKVDFDEPCKGLDKSVNSFNTPKGESGVKVSTSTTYGERDNIIESTLATTTDYRDMQDNEDSDKGVTMIQISSTTSMGKDIKTIILKAYAANIGDSPEMLSRSW
ncbi:type II secretion system protein [Campylobacter rectus]|uniref:type II secretion system protein n=1 Tax=Campylobacter rectus TaxID=203 RepID=UPI0023EF8C0B|nr:type II secretion system protein [Campylobacter rectus]